MKKPLMLPRQPGQGNGPSKLSSRQMRKTIDQLQGLAEHFAAENSAMLLCIGSLCEANGGSVSVTPAFLQEFKESGKRVIFDKGPSGELVFSIAATKATPIPEEEPLPA